MKTLSREDIIRMKDNRASGSSSSSSGDSFDPYAMGLATQMWVQSNYVSIEFFKKIFKALNGSTEVLPNDTDSTITSIKAMYGFWTEQYVSALGQSAGGGGGGATALTDLVDVNPLMQPTAGQVLTYNATLGKWTAMDPQGGGADMQTVWSALAASTSEQINASHLSTALSGYARVGTDGVMEIGQYLDFHVLGTTSDYSTRIYAANDAENTVTLPTSTGTLALTSDNVASASRLSGNTPYTAWGQTFWNNGVPQSISGNITDAGNILPTSSSSYDIGTTNKTFRRLYLGTNAGDDVYLEYDSANKAIHVKNAGFYADTYVSALGISSGGGGGGGGDIVILDSIGVDNLLADIY